MFHKCTERRQGVEMKQILMNTLEACSDDQITKELKRMHGVSETWHLEIKMQPDLNNFKPLGLCRQKSEIFVLKSLLLHLLFFTDCFFFQRWSRNQNLFF